MKTKKIKFGASARDAMIDGINEISDAVASTIGPRGRDVIVDNPNDAPPLVTNDGVFIAGSISFKDNWKNLGAKIIKQAAEKTNDDAGDGTTTATILTRALIVKGITKIVAGMNPIEIKEGMLSRAKEIVGELRKKSVTIEGEGAKEKLNQIAAISGQHEEIGEILADVFDKVGTDSLVTIEDSNKPEIGYELIDGFNFPSGYFHPMLCTNFRSMESIMENVPILVSGTPITNNNDIAWGQTLFNSGVKSVVIVAPDFGGIGLKTLLQNHALGNIKVNLIKAPYQGERQKQYLQDIATVVGARLIDPEIGMKLSEIDLNADLGGADRVVSEKNRTIIVGGKGIENAPKRIEELKGLIENEKAEWVQEQLKERLACLNSGLAVIQVGAITEIEQKELRFKVEDAINATRSALEEGYLPGGGIALAKASQVDNFNKEGCSDDFISGRKIINEACFAPLKQIIENAGENYGKVIAEITNDKNIDFSIGWNAKNKTTENLLESGVIDPTKVVCSALLNAASAASTLLITNTAITYDEEKDSEANK